MGKGALVWFVITLQPGGGYDAKPYHFEPTCRTVAEAYQRINEQVGNGKDTICAQTSPSDLADFAERALTLR